MIVITILTNMHRWKFHLCMLVKKQLECGPMPNVMVALSNIGGALCSTPQSLAEVHYYNRAVTLPRRESRWNWKGSPKLAYGSQPLVARSSLYYEDMWRRYRCLTSFFPIVETCLSCEDTARQICAMVPKWRFFCVLYIQRAACSTFQTCFLNSH